MSMTVKQLIRELQREVTAGNGNLKVQLYAHDQEPSIHDEGDGYLSSVWAVTDDLGEKFIALHA